MLSEKLVRNRFMKYYDALVWTLYGRCGYSRREVLTNKDDFRVKGTQEDNPEDRRLYFYRDTPLFSTCVDRSPQLKDGKFEVLVVMYNKTTKTPSKEEKIYIG